MTPKPYQTPEFAWIAQTGCQTVIYCPKCYSPVVDHPASIQGHKERVHPKAEL